MSNQLAKLKEKLKKAAVIRGNIIMLAKGVQSFRCQNSFHGPKEMVYLTFAPNGPTEIECECGTIYKREETK